MEKLFTRNDAVRINAPDGVDLALTSHGSNWLWAAFSLFSLAIVVYFIASIFLKSPSRRFFLKLSTLQLLFIAVSYFTMASNLGSTGVQAEFNHVTTDTQETTPGVRQVFYARYIGWFLAFPAVTFGFSALFRVSWAATMTTILSQTVIVISLLIGAVISTSYKWGYYVFGLAGYVLFAFQVIVEFFPAASVSGSWYKIGAYVILSVALLLQLLYFVAWALAEGGNVIEVDSEAVFYGVLDVLYFFVNNLVFLIVASKAIPATKTYSFGTNMIFQDDVPAIKEEIPLQEMDAPRDVIPTEREETTQTAEETVTNMA